MTYIRRLILALALSAGLAPAFAQVPPPVPALPDTERRTTYSISASTCACNVNFALYGDSTDYANWIEVFVNGVRMAQPGNWTLSSATGTIGSIPLPITNAVLTFTAPQTGTIQIVGARRPRRTSQFNEGAGVPTRNFNVVLSDLTAQNRELWDKTNDVTGRALLSQPGNTVGLLPLPSACSGKFLGFDVTGLIPQCNTGGPGSGNVVGPGSSVNGHFATFSGTSGALLVDGGAVAAIANSGSANDLVSGSVALASGGLGASQAAATANQIPVLPGSGGAAVPTSAPTWFDSAYCNTAGFLIARLTGAWTCSRSVPLNVQWLGAVADGVTDNSAIINGAIATLISSYGGGTILLPPANNVYCVFTGITANTGSSTSGDIHIVGTGTRFSALDACGHNVNVVTINNQFVTIQRVAIYGYGMRSTDATFTGTAPSAAAVLLLPGASNCRIQDAYIAGGTQAIQLQASGCVLDNVTAQFAYGDGANGNAVVYIISSGSNFRNSHFDQVWPQAQPAHGATIAARANTTVYALGVVVTVTCNARTFLWQATVAGTSGGSQPTCKIYGQPVTDGTVTWQLVGPRTYYGVQVDTGANENFFDEVDMTGSFAAGLAITNTFAGAAPQATNLNNSTMGGTIDQGLLASSGSGLIVSNSEVSRCVLATCAAFQLSGAWTGPAILNANRVINNVSFGILSTVGTQLIANDNFISTADTLSISIAPAASGAYAFNLIGNMVTGTGITISANVAAGSRYSALGNNCGGAAWTDSSAGGTGYPVRGAAMNAANCF